MKKILLLSILTFTLGCNPTIDRDQSDILNLIGEEYLKNKHLEKLTKNGIAFQQFENLSDIKKVLLKINDLNDKRFSEEVAIVKETLFNKSEITNYILQIDTINYSEIHFKNPKIRSFKLVKKDQQQYQYYKQIVSKPLFSTDKEYAIVIISGAHIISMKILKKNLKNQWSYLGMANIFP